MTPPGAACQFVKFLPIAFLPSGHSEKNLRFVICCVHPSFGSVLFIFTSRSQHWMLNFYKRFVKWHTAKPLQRTENAQRSAKAKKKRWRQEDGGLLKQRVLYAIL